MSEYSNTLKRVELLHQIIDVDVKRIGYVDSDSRKTLHEKIMKASDQEFLDIENDFEKTKHMSLREIEEYRSKENEEPKKFISLSERKTSIMDFNLDANSLAILNGTKKPDEQQPKGVKANPYEKSALK